MGAMMLPDNAVKPEPGGIDIDIEIRDESLVCNSIVGKPLRIVYIIIGNGISEKIAEINLNAVDVIGQYAP